MSMGERSAFEAKIEEVRGTVGDRFAAWREVSSSEEFRSMELEAAELGRSIADAITEDVLRERLKDSAFLALTTAAALSCGRRMRRSGSSKQTVRLLGGSAVDVRVPYLRPDRRGRPGPKRKPGQHGKSGTGMYPALEALGIQWKVTPALAAEVARQVTASEAFRPALEALRGRGINLGYKQTLRLVQRYGTRAAEQRRKWLEAVLSGQVPPSEALAGKRVVLAVDGGRLRLRVPYRRGRRRKNGHRGFDTPWCEPKVFVVYVIDSCGQIDESFRTVCDGTLGDCEAVFELIVAYLHVLGVGDAERLIVLGDGAKWIWERAPELADKLGLPSDKLVQIVDKYHAVEYLGDILRLTEISSPAGDSWLRRARYLLGRGDIKHLVEHIRELAQTSDVAEVAGRVDYFVHNKHRMQYAAFRRAGLPIGSGAAESAIRRVLNLRLKGSSKFWLAENAEGMLLLRCYLKAGRFDDLVAWTNAAALPWWEEFAEHSPLGADVMSEVPFVEMAA